MSNDDFIKNLAHDIKIMHKDRATRRVQGEFRGEDYQLL